MAAIDTVAQALVWSLASSPGVFGGPNWLLLGQAAGALALGDLNHDGNQDTAITLPEASSMALVLGSRGDLNRDGHLDFFLSDDNNNGLSLLAQ